MIKSLTSLRFFFAFFVFLSHLSFLELNPSFRFFFKHIFSEGFLGVSFFFVLSGFILALNYSKRLSTGKTSLSKFYIARFARIYPLHFLTLIGSIPFFFTSLKNFFINALLLQSFFPSKQIYFSYNAPSWSISNEFFFYALFPLIIYINNKVTYVIKMITIIVFSLIIIFLNNVLPENKIHYWIYISPLTRIFDFIIGVFLYDLYLYIKKHQFHISTKTKNILEICSILSLIIFFIFKQHFSISFRYSIYYWIPMCLIILTFAITSVNTKNKTVISTLLSKKGLVYLGEISFAFYLIHYIIMEIVIKYNTLLTNQISEFYLTFIIFSLTLLSSIFVFEKFEKPLNKKIKSLFL